MYVSFAILRIRDYVFLTIRTSPLEEYGLFSHPFIQTDWLFAWDKLQGDFLVLLRMQSSSADPSLRRRSGDPLRGQCYILAGCITTQPGAEELTLR